MYKLLSRIFKSRKPVSRYKRFTFRSFDDLFFDGDTICFKRFNYNVKLEKMESSKNFIYGEGFVVKNFEDLLYGAPEIYATSYFYKSSLRVNYIANTNILIKRQKILLTEKVTF